MFERQIERALKQYSLLMRAQCRMWASDKYPADDLFSESMIVLMRLVRYHGDLGIESKQFKNLLLKAIKNRIIDLQRLFSTQRRDRRCEFSYSPELDDIQSDFLRGSNVSRPDELVETLHLIKQLHAKLSEIDQRMLSQLLDPTDELLAIARNWEAMTLKRSGRRSSGATTDIPVYILGSRIGLSYKQAMESLRRIRETLSCLLVDD